MRRAPRDGDHEPLVGVLFQQPQGIVSNQRFREQFGRDHRATNDRDIRPVPLGVRLSRPICLLDGWDHLDWPPQIFPRAWMFGKPACRQPLVEELLVLVVGLAQVVPWLITSEIARIAGSEIARTAQVPLAAMLRGIALPMQNRFGVGKGIRRQRCLAALAIADVHQNAMRVRVETRDDRGPRRRTVGGHAGRAVKPRPFAPDPIHVGRSDVPIPRRGKRAIVLLIGHEKQDIVAGARLLTGYVLPTGRGRQAGTAAPTCDKP